MKTLSDKRSSKSCGKEESQFKILIYGEVDRNRAFLRCTVYIDEKYLAGDHVLYSCTELGCTYIYRFLLRDIPDLATAAIAIADI